VERGKDNTGGVVEALSQVLTTVVFAALQHDGDGTGYGTMGRVAGAQAMGSDAVGVGAW
jgi:hypothetical protein